MPNEDRYPTITRWILSLHRAGELTNVRDLHIEPRYGYVGRMVYADGSVRMMRLMNLNFNGHGAAQIATDKHFTKHFLQQIGVITPRGRTFLTPHFFRHYPQTHLTESSNYNGLDDIAPYVAQTLGYPCFIKPNDASQGRGVHKCTSADDVAQAVAALRDDVFDIVLVEEAVTLPEYRVVVYEDEIICAYSKMPLQLMGDGEQTIRELLAQQQTAHAAQSRPVKLESDAPLVERTLARQGFTLASVPDVGATVTITDTANLSLGSSAADVTDTLHPQWQVWAVDIAAQMGLRFCGIDLCCADISQPASDYSVLEINASPSMVHYASLSDATHERVMTFLVRVLNQPPRQ